MRSSAFTSEKSVSSAATVAPSGSGSGGVGRASGGCSAVGGIGTGAAFFVADFAAG